MRGHRQRWAADLRNDMNATVSARRPGGMDSNTPITIEKSMSKRLLQHQTAATQHRNSGLIWGLGCHCYPTLVWQTNYWSLRAQLLPRHECSGKDWRKHTLFLCFSVPASPKPAVCPSSMAPASGWQTCSLLLCSSCRGAEDSWNCSLGAIASGSQYSTRRLAVMFGGLDVVVP
jgi:hypothetical protein